MLERAAFGVASLIQSALPPNWITFASSRQLPMAFPILHSSPRMLADPSFMLPVESSIRQTRTVEPTDLMARVGLHAV